MQIAGLPPGYADSSAIARRGEPGRAVDGQTEGKTLQAAAGANATMEILAKIVSRYDLREITPRDFSEMLRRLRDSGALSETEYRDLVQIRVDLDASNIDADQPIDLLKFYRQMPERPKRQGDWRENSTEAAALLETAKRRLAWLEKVAALQESPESAGISALV